MRDAGKLRELGAFLSQFRVVRCDYEFYCERDGVLYSSEQVADFANAVGISVKPELIQKVLTRRGWVEFSPYEVDDLRHKVVGFFPLRGWYNGAEGLYYLTGQGMVFIPLTGEPIMFGQDRSHGYYRFAGVGADRRLDLAGTEADFWAYWEAATNPLGWDARVSAAVMLPVLLGQTTGGWILCGGEPFGELSLFMLLVLLVWGHLPEKMGMVVPEKFRSKAHERYIERTGLVGLFLPPDCRLDVLARVELAFGAPPFTRQRVGVVCSGGQSVPSEEARRLLRVPMKPQTFPVFWKHGGFGRLQPKALMGAFRLFQRAAQAPYSSHPICAVTGWVYKWGAWALRYGEALGVREEVAAVFSDYLGQWAANASRLSAIRKVFASPSFAPYRRYTLSALREMGKLSPAEIAEIERALYTFDGQNVFDWVTSRLGYRLVKHPKTPTRPVRLSFRPLKRAAKGSRSKQKRKAQRPQSSR
jgi:hypothetical protein